MSIGEKKNIFDGSLGKYLLPGIILQSVLIGGGYATGREVISFGAKYGAFGWLGGLGIFLGFTVMSILTFEIARIFRVYDYKSLVQQIAGKLWMAYDVIYLLLALLVIAVMASASGEMLKMVLGIPYWVGVTTVIVIVGILNFYGDRLIEKFETWGTVVLYIAYIIFGILVFISPEAITNIKNVFANMDTSYVADSTISVGKIIWTGLTYVGYNLVVYPSTFFTLKRQTKRKETVWAGIISGIFMTIPWFITYFAFMGFYPSEEIMGAPIPWVVVLQKVGGPLVLAIFGITIGWTLIATATGMIHAFLGRLNLGLRDMGKSELEPKQNAILTIVILVIAALLAKIGIVDLIGKGYTMLAYGMILVYAIPLLTVGTYKIIKHGSKKELTSEATVSEVQSNK